MADFSKVVNKTLLNFVKTPSSHATWAVRISLTVLMCLLFVLILHLLGVQRIVY